jgi:ParB family transcriptional regulator, chromosome partitioning protein
VPETREINVNLLLEPPLTERSTMDDEKLHELAESIKVHGVLQNLVVVPSNGKYEIVAGHRRYLAARLAGLEHVPCKIYEDLEDGKYAVMMAENGFREEVTAADEGMFFLDLAEKKGWSEPQLCKYFHRSAEYINERCKLVTKYPEVMKSVRAREMNFSQAKAIMRCKLPKWQPWLIEQAVTHGATARSLNQYVDQFHHNDLSTGGPVPNHSSEQHPLLLEPEKQRCVWCQRNDDQVNITELKIHSYHVRDLTEFLKATGIRPRSEVSQGTDPHAV